MIDAITAQPGRTAIWIAIAILTLYIARPYVRAVLTGLAGAPARVVRGAALRLRAESRRVGERYKARVREAHRQELEERLTRMTGQLECRLQSDINRADATLMRLRDSADRVIFAADDADPSRIADRVVEGVTGEESHAKRGKGALGRARTEIADSLKASRGRARSLKPDARRILSAADKLRLVEHKLSRHAQQMNDAAEKYETLVKSDERGEAAGDASIFVPWFAALLVIAIAAAGAVLNFELITRPMAELVGDGAQVAGVPLASLAAITLILLEAAAGVVLMEAIGATQLLPVFRRMAPRLTVGFGVAALFFLGVFSVVEVALAFTRDAIIALDAEVLRAAAGETANAEPVQSLPVALIAQALLGAAIPWILAVVAIPAETVINNTRFIVEAAWKQTLALVAFLLAALGSLLRAASHGLLTIYDLAIFPALAIDQAVRFALGSRAGRVAATAPAVTSARAAPPRRLPAPKDDLEDTPETPRNGESTAHMVGRMSDERVTPHGERSVS